MKILVEFNFPEDQYDYDSFLKLQAMRSSLREYAEFLRNMTKYSDFPKAQAKVWEEARGEFYKICSDNDLDPSD